MRISSKEAREILDADNFVLFRNYATPPDVSLFYKAYTEPEYVTGSDLGPMKILPKYFFENKNVSNFYDECSNLYGVNTTLLLISGVKSENITEKHSDESDVIHWQCIGQSEWTMYDNPKGSKTKFILNAGDIVLFKESQYHSVKNLQTKFSIIFNSNNILRDSIKKRYSDLGIQFI